MTRSGAEAVHSCDYANTFLHQVLLSKVQDDMEIWKRFINSLTSSTTEVS